MFKIFLLSYFEYFQIWLNIFMNDCHLSNIIKLKQKTKNKTYTNVFLTRTSLIFNFKEYWNLFIKPKSWWCHFSFCERTSKFDVSCFYYVLNIDSPKYVCLILTFLKNWIYITFERSHSQWDITFINKDSINIFPLTTKSEIYVVQI